MTTVYLYGALGRKFGSRWTLDVKSPAEAVRAIMANRPDFRTYMIQRSQPGYHVLIGNDVIGGADRLHDPSGRHCIKIIPAIAGAKSGVMQIIVGVILVAAVVASFWVDPTGTLALTLSSGGLTPLGYAAVGVGMMGAGMIVSGVTTMLTGTPSGPSFDMLERKSENKPSFLFNGPVNTSAQGHAISIGYGRLRVGSAVISAGVATEDIA